MDKINRNISFTSDIKIVGMRKLNEINQLKLWAPGHIFPIKPNINTRVKIYENTADLGSRTCTSIHIIGKPEGSSSLKDYPVHIFDTATIGGVTSYVKKMLKAAENIQSILAWGFKDMLDEAPKTKKIFETALNILSEENEVTYFKGHSTLYDGETNAVFKGSENTMYLCPRSLVDDYFIPSNEEELKYLYEDYHIAASDKLDFSLAVI